MRRKRQIRSGQSLVMIEKRCCSTSSLYFAFMFLHVFSSFSDVLEPTSRDKEKTHRCSVLSLSTFWIFFYLYECHYCMFCLVSALPTDNFTMLLLKQIILNLRWDTVSLCWGRPLLPPHPTPPLLPALISIAAVVYVSYPYPSSPRQSLLMVPSSYFVLLTLCPVERYKMGLNLTFRCHFLFQPTKALSWLTPMMQSSEHPPTTQHATFTGKYCQAFC